jgi:hypothetical protein
MPVLAGEKLAGHLPGHVEHGQDADSFVFPNRPVWIAWVVVPALIAAVCMADAALRVLSGKPPGDVSAALMPFMSFEATVLTGLAMGGLAVLSLLGIMLDTRRIDVTPTQVRVRRGLLGLGFHRTIPRAQVTAVEAKASGLQQPTTFEVKLLLQGGGTQSVATTLRTLDQAEALAARLRGILQVPPPNA